MGVWELKKKRLHSPPPHNLPLSLSLTIYRIYLFWTSETETKITYEFSPPYRRRRSSGNNILSSKNNQKTETP